MKFINQQKTSFSIEITPLIDIVFLLVIFFVVTSKVGDSQFLSLDLPKTESFEYNVVESNNEISITSDGSIYITDNTKYHTAINGGEEDRIHLVATLLN